MATKYFQVTANELLALTEVAETCWAMIGSGDISFDKEAADAMKAIKRIQKRNGISIESDFSGTDQPAVPNIYRT
ncbi:MAG: hypothetical protein SwStaBPW_28470 [Shewanella algae]